MSLRAIMGGSSSVDCLAFEVRELGTKALAISGCKGARIEPDFGKVHRSRIHRMSKYNMGLSSHPEAPLIRAYNTADSNRAF